MPEKSKTRGIIEGDDSRRIGLMKRAAGVGDLEDFDWFDDFGVVLHVEIPIEINDLSVENGEVTNFDFEVDKNRRSQIIPSDPVDPLLEKELKKLPSLEGVPSPSFLSTQRLFINMSDELIDEFVDAENPKVRKTTKDVGRDIIQLHEIGEKHGHLVSSVHPEYMPKYKIESLKVINSLARLLHAIDNLKTLSIPDKTSKRLSELGSLIEEEEFWDINGVLSKEEISGIKDFRSNVRQKRGYNTEIHEVLQIKEFLFEEHNLTRQDISELIEYGSVVSNPRIWLCCLLYDIQDGLPPKEAATNGTYRNNIKYQINTKNKNKIKNDSHDISKKQKEILEQELVDHPELIIFEVIDIDESGSQISKTWYGYNPPHLRSLSKDSPVLQGVRQTIFRRRFMSDVNLINNGFRPSILSESEYQTRNITKTPFQMAMSGDVSAEGLSELFTRSPSRFDEKKYLKKVVIERAFAAWGFESIDEIMDWHMRGNLPKNMH
jgi:hypothetical protein